MSDAIREVVDRYHDKAGTRWRENPDGTLTAVDRFGREAAQCRDDAQFELAEMEILSAHADRCRERLIRGDLVGPRFDKRLVAQLVSLGKLHARDLVYAKQLEDAQAEYQRWLAGGSRIPK